MNIEELIKKTAQATAAEIIEQCKDKRKKDSQLGSFKKTERILYEYPHWQQIDTADTVKFCMLVERALHSISKDPYYKIIELKYFQKWTHERIAEFFNVDVSVISKQRTKLINALRSIIFSDEFIKELYENQ